MDFIVKALAEGLVSGDPGGSLKAAVASQVLERCAEGLCSSSETAQFPRARTVQ